MLVSAEKPEVTCPPAQFKCTNGNCIDNAKVCDKTDDCEDNSDEPPHCHINECLKVEVHHCGHKCVNTLTSYRCECNEGYK